MNERVDLFGGHARAEQFPDFEQRIGCHLAACTDGLDLTRAFNINCHGIGGE
jgi:hypothetical protein